MCVSMARSRLGAISEGVEGKENETELNSKSEKESIFIVESYGWE